MKKSKKISSIVIYQAPNGAIEFRGDFSRETIWASLDQIAGVFDRDKSVISRHIKNIFREGELKRNSVVAFFATTAADGKTYKVEYFNLDVIISVGYRVNSKKATIFRIWATKILREHIIKGYTINRKQIAKNYDAFMNAVTDVQTLLPEHIALDPKTILELIKEFSSTWVSLDAYDKDTLKPIGATKKDTQLTGKELLEAIGNLRNELMRKGEAGELFAQERARGNVEGIVGNVMQSFGGKSLYASIEKKAAHLLYFYKNSVNLVKN